MALELVAGGAISATFELLLNNLSSISVSLLRRETDSGFDSLLQRLKTTFLCLSSVLDDAEQKEMRNTAVKEWLDELQDAVEDAEDLFDEIKYDALKLKVTNKLKKLLSPFNLTKRKAAMENFLERLDTFIKQIETLDLQQPVNRIQSLRPPSICSIDESEFFGRDEETNRLKGMLLSDEIGREKIRVIPIVGMGGIGKTTLAQAVYNDDQVSNYFQLKAWLCVSDEDDVLKVTKILYEGIAGNREACAFENINVVVEKLQEKLKDKKFLIIFDDVWCEDCAFWEKMRVILNVGAQGSKIIITTRSSKVASIMGTTEFCHLNKLHEEACLELFKKIVSRREDFIADSDSETIGKEVVKKCKGLPLAVRALASLLKTIDVKEWDKIAKSDVLDEKTDILPALRLSYYYLPSHLKKCFVYCCLFPKDYRFEKDELVSLWMANDLLEHSSRIRNQTRREVGYGYFNDLVSRSFFQSSSRYFSDDCFVMHDLMVDLANSVSKKRFIYIEKNKSCEIELTKTRHIAFGCYSPEIFKLISEATCLRTFLSRYPQQKNLLKDLVKWKRLRFLSLQFFNVPELPESIGELRHLRFLDLSYTRVKELPKSFCKLHNLQTLKMDGCDDLIEFPKKFYNLINLRYLLISCDRLRKLPPLGQLPALEILEIKECHAIKKVGLEFYGATSTPFPSLETLKFVESSKWKKWSVPKINVEAFRKLKSLIILDCESLRGDLPYLLPSLVELHILQCPMLGSWLPMMPDVSEVRIENCHKIAGFKSSNLDKGCVPAKLTNLGMSYCGNIEFLPPHKYEFLQKLSIEETSSSSFEFLQSDTFPNIMKLEMKNCGSVASFLQCLSPMNYLSSLKIHRCPNFTTCKLPPLGQLPALETLEIKRCDSIEMVGLEFYGTTSTPFPSLQTLKFCYMSNWKEWSVPEVNVEAFPNLKSLIINACENLIGDLPYLLPSLVELRILQCRMLDSWLPIMPNVSEVRIEKCDKIAGFKSSNFDERCVPTGLTNLCIISCGTIQFLPPHKYEFLQKLSIEETSSSSLEFLQIDTFPNIKKIEMKICESLMFFSQVHSPINYLSTLEIHGCPNFKLSPDINLHCPTLTQLRLSSCRKLRFLPDKLPSLLPSLQELLISCCPELESLPIFGLPLSLRQLAIIDCDKVIASRKNWNLRALPYLTNFGLRFYEGKDMESFLEQGFMPASLVSLHIGNVACLKTLDDKGFQELTSLKELTILSCPNLERLPVKGLPPSFEGSLPPSFESFFMQGCPLLDAKYEWKRDEDGFYKKICCPRPQVTPSL